MLEKWTGEVVGTAHIYGISLQELAKEVGLSRQLLSAYLHEKRKSVSAESRIRKALMALVEKKETPPDIQEEY